MGATILRHIEMVGRLAKNTEINKNTSVFINRQNDIQYRIKSLSLKNDVKEDFFTGYISSINNLEFSDNEFVDDTYSAPEDRIQAFSEFYSKSLFIFSHKIDATGISKIESADIIPCSSRITTEDNFIAIPCFCGKHEFNYVYNFQLYKEYENYEQFKKFLFEGKPIGRIYNFQISELDNFPEFIIWDDEEKMCAIGPIKKVSRTPIDSFVIDINPDEIYEIDLDDESDDTIEYMVQSGSNPTLIHITEQKYLEIVNKISQKGKRINEDSKPIQNMQIKQSGYNNIHNQSLSNSNNDNEKSNTNDQVIESSRELPREKSETAILEFFRYHSQKNKLFYSPKDIANFHTSIKTGNLVILSGMSGTGKSALVDTYAKALGISKNMLIIPVRPSWNDDSDLLGYVDLIHMVYRPSDTGFINKIVEASKPENKDKLYLICLDEMNLARVEHYFSQFLSILEKPVGTRELMLYDEQYEGQLYNSSKYPHKISIGENIKFVGTVNIDESTYHFSDKVLDRANVITLEVLDYSKPNNWREDKYIVANTPEWTNEEFSKLVKKDDTNIANQDRIRDFLWNMHLLLQNVNINLGVGPRIVKSIENYLRNIPECQTEYSLSEKEALDYQVTQRILTKIRGSEDQLKDLFDLTDNSKTLTSLLDNYSDISDFEKCKRAIKQKEKELKIYGYCL